MALGLVSLAVAGCDRHADTGPVIVSAIRAATGAAAPSRPGSTEGDMPHRVLRDSLAQGLVRFDANGQIEPGLAERWIVIDGGGSYIFRLRDAKWNDGTPVTAEQVVPILRRLVSPRSGNPLTPFLTAIDEIVVMTPQVIEVRLSRPRPDLLKLFAQPEMAIIDRARHGTGPFRIVRAGPPPLLRPIPDPRRAEPDDAATPAPEDDVRLIAESPARAILRFARGNSDLVLGGRFETWPLIDMARVNGTAIRVDPAAGLFGLAIANREGFLADPANRQALSAAFDRATILSAIAPNWEAADRLLPDALDSDAPPQIAGWALLNLNERRASARARVVAAGQPIRLRIALPQGPGANLLYGQIGATLRAIGITPERVALDAPADLRLVDAVAPFDSARWYLATACAPCGPEAQAAIEQARLAPTLAARSAAIAAADAALNADAPFIPLARPLRWSLVTGRLRQYQPNVRAWHPLNRLRADTN
ncbi:ABC transporter substrate-binding protein [uncultured Sphingomonas sp.]|uniref:ABC transporter substrate-binding protein n=1 Tax=uncultured Sphingomonas sp. TaxID=158754 RepID=UPI0025E94303|nr:ABC transporter substrate-binding protein [uncultured Sphingomonas sp.]